MLKSVCAEFGIGMRVESCSRTDGSGGLASSGSSCFRFFGLPLSIRRHTDSLLETSKTALNLGKSDPVSYGGKVRQAYIVMLN